MARKPDYTIALEADPNDTEDRPVTVDAVERALADRRIRRQARPGRPEGSDKERITIRLDKDLLARWRATGPGWQTRMNDALRKVTT